MEKFIFGLIYRLYVDNTALFITDSAYWLSTTVKKEKERERRRHPQKECKTGVFPSTLILKLLN